MRCGWRCGASRPDDTTVLTLGHVLEALTGHPVAGHSPSLTEAVIDSRLARPGTLFVALPGEQTDGHQYVAAALANGAVAALIHQDVAVDVPVLDLRQSLPPETPLPTPVCLRVEDTLQALQTVAGWWRARLQVRVIGITGSVGKTTTKELVAAVLGTRYRTLKSEGNFNNEIGLPLMLLKLTTAHERAVLEMGFYVVGEIALLCRLARPQVGVVNNVYGVHLERAGTLDNIVQGKGELVEALPADGVAILNADDPQVMRMPARLRGARVFTYGLQPTADLWADRLESLGLRGIRFTLHHGSQAVDVTFPLLGQHAVYTALRAAAVGLVEGVAWPEIVAGLQNVKGAHLRLVAVPGPAGSLLLDDTYNASPESVLAALNLLGDVPAQRRLAVLGDMLELGAEEEAGHRRVGHRAGQVAHVLVTVGPRARLMAEAARQAGLAAANVVELTRVDEVLEFLRPRLGPGDVALFKGSHGLRLDRLVAALKVRP